MAACILDGWIPGIITMSPVLWSLAGKKLMETGTISIKKKVGNIATHWQK